MKSFVTGGAGFIGSHLVERLLKRGDTVTVYDNLSFGHKAFLREAQQHPKFHFMEGDLLDVVALGRAVTGHERVFHLAANSDIMRAMHDPSLDFQQGIQATFSLLEAMRQKQIRQILYFSGSGVYGDWGDKPMSETTAGTGPRSMYGAAKMASEGMIGAYSHLYDIQAWILRPANIIGSRPTHGVLFDFIRKLKTDPKRLEILGNGAQSKSYLHVEDCLDALFLVLEKAKDKMNIFNVSSESYVTVREIAALVTRAMGLQDVAMTFGQEAGGWKGDIPVCRLSVDKIKKIGWTAKLSSAQAIEKTIREILQVNSFAPRDDPSGRHLPVT